VETIYYGHVPPARDRRPSERRLEVVLKATRGVRNNIPYRGTVELIDVIDVEVGYILYSYGLKTQEGDRLFA